ncbi:MAG: ABC transporter transmembrane domain-containing protein, partial [Chloroflexota bacterium]
MAAQARQQQWGGQQKSSSTGGLGRAIRYLGKQKRSAILAYGALIIATLAQLAVPQLVQNMIDAVTRGTIANSIFTATANVPDLLRGAALNLAATQAGTTVDAMRDAQVNGESWLMSAALFIVIFAATRAVFSFVQAYMGEKTSQGVAYDFRNEIFAKVQRLSFSYHDRNQTGQLMIRATDDVEKVRLFIAQGLMLTAQAFLLLIATLVILFITNWQLTLV